MTNNTDDLFNLAVTAVFAALGVIIPMIFHAAGIGQVFMPMFIPLAVGAYLISPRNALLSGALTPFASALITGMPPFYPPVALVMIPELALFCYTISILHNKTAMPRIAVIIAAVAADRLFIFGAYYFIYPLLGIASSFSLVNIFKGMPGLLIVIGSAPVISSRIEYMFKKTVVRPYEFSPDAAEDLKNG